MWIVVDANEARNGLAERLAESWDFVNVRRLSAGDVAIGPQVLVERKTVDDFVASMGDGRLFQQARRLAAVAPRPLIIQEGDPILLARRVDEGAYRGALLSLSVGFRIPVLMTRDLGHTAIVLRHMAAQESKRHSRRRRREQKSGQTASGHSRLSPEAVEVLCAVPGVGRRRAEALASHLASLSDLAGLGVRDLLSIPGIGPDTAAKIVDTLRGTVPR